MLPTITYAAKLRRHTIKGFMLQDVPFYNTQDIERAVGLSWQTLDNTHRQLCDYTQRQYMEWDCTYGNEEPTDDIVQEDITPNGRYIITFTADTSGWDCLQTVYMDWKALSICLASQDLSKAAADALQVWRYALMGTTTQDIPRHVKRNPENYGGIVAVLDQLHNDGVVWKKGAA